MALDTISNIQYLADVNTAMNDMRAVEYYTEAAEMAEQLLGNDHPKFLALNQKLKEVKELFQ